MTNIELTPDDLARTVTACMEHGMTVRQVDGMARLVAEEARSNEDRQGLALALVDAADVLQAAAEDGADGGDALQDAVRNWGEAMIGNPWPEFLLQCALPDGWVATDAASFADACRELGEVLYVPEDEIA